MYHWQVHHGDTWAPGAPLNWRPGDEHWVVREPMEKAGAAWLPGVNETGMHNFKYSAQLQWPCNRNRFIECNLPYIRPFFEAYVREYAQKIWPDMAQYLHFWILDFPLTSTGQSWDPKSETDFCSVWAKLEFYRVRLPVHHRHPSTLRIFLTVRPSAVPTAASSARASTATRQASCRWSSRLRRCRSLPCRDWACFFFHGNLGEIWAVKKCILNINL